MRLPSKVTPYSECTLSKFPPILRQLSVNDLRPAGLYRKVKSKFTDIDEFADTLDCLFALGKIELLYPEEVLHYVGRVRQ
ncbi:ABC-three component system middle component 7 [Gleimia europaea]|uniref:ABC-three component system middle component 7 n=1 Tax=Gleimia europaea TaxID=66228 RepID=UPI0032B474B6